MSKHIVIITPIFYGSGTGAAIYYRLLVEAFCDRGFICTVISERSAELTHRYPWRYFGILPTRTGKNKQIVRDILIYALQNFAYLRLPRLIQSIQPDIVLVHSSFYNFPGIFPQVMQWLMRHRRANQRFVVDVRDVLLPTRQADYLNDYEKVIACSENVFEQLKRYGVSQDQIELIPVLQESLSVDPAECETLLTELGLYKTPYVLYAGMIKELKAVDLLLEAFIQFVRPRSPDLVLVMVGYLKTANSKIHDLLKAPGVSYLGNRPRREVNLLMAGAKLCVNLSPHESLSRSSLEALALKCPVLLPPNVAEFMQFCPSFVANSRDPQVIAQQILETMNHGALPNYPVERHYPQHVVAAYEKIFDVMEEA